MKHIATLLKISSIALLTLFVFSCHSDDDNNVPDRTVYELLSDNAELSTFKAAVDRIPELRELLNDEGGVIPSFSGSLTVFAPTNAAFDAFLPTVGAATIDDVSLTDLAIYLANHITQDETDSNTMETETMGYLTTFGNISMFFNASGSTIALNGNAGIVKSDLRATNGIVHTTNAIIQIPTLTTFMNVNPDFGTMRDALLMTEAQAGSPINNELSTFTQYTVFVPTNNAFDSLYDEVGIGDISDINPVTLEDIIEAHIIKNHNITAANIGDAVGGILFTFGAALDVNVDAAGNYTLTDPQDRPAATVIRTDVRAANGIIHIIDKVLLPL